MIAIYIGDRRLDLFKDESIKLTSALNDIEKLSNVFNDFTQSFTVPATANNNEIFQYYYDMDYDNTFNANIRVDAYLELNTVPFRFGSIELESVKVKSGRPDSYKITFFGGLTQLSELFGDDLISELDYKKEIVNGVETKVKTWNSLSQFDYAYSSTNFINSINLPTFQNGQIITPLIAWSERDWGYQLPSGKITLDIKTDTGAILDSELRPAIRIENILNAIETKYGITFTKQFFNKSVFKNLFMWLNGREAELTQNEYTINLNPFSGTNDGSFSYTAPNINIRRRSYSESYDVDYIFQITYSINVSVPTARYDVIVYNESNEVIRTFQRTGNTTNTITRFDRKGYEAVEFVEEKYRLVILPYSNNTFTINTSVYYTRSDQSGATPNVIYVNVNSIGTVVNLTPIIKIEEHLPNLKVNDFFTGIMKMFKLVIRPETSTRFYVNTIDGFYGDGEYLDLTDYVDISNIDYERPLIYKEIDFTFKESNNVNSTTFRRTFGLGYGDLKARYPQISNKETLKVELPFENMMFERLRLETGTGEGNFTDIYIGQSVSADENSTSVSKNKSGPILFYYNGISSIPQTPIRIKFQNNSSIPVAYVHNVGNTDDMVLSQVKQAVNWGSENDPWHLTRIDNSLYLNYWNNWINTIYDLKQRKVKLRAILPPRIIDRLSLNDRILISGQRYKINDFSVNLTTGETDFNLFKDIYDFSSPPPVVFPTSLLMNAGTKFMSVNINKVNTSWSATVSYSGTESGWITLQQTSGTRPTELVFLVSPKAQQVPPLVFEDRQATININVDGTNYPVIVTQNKLITA